MTNIDDQARTWRRRLEALQLQKAQYGSTADPSVTIEIEDLEKALGKIDDIKGQLRLLEINRGNAGHLMVQRASFGDGNVPIHIINQLNNVRERISQIKRGLREYYKVDVDPVPEDDDPIVDRQPTTINPPVDERGAVRERLHTLEYLVRNQQTEAALTLIQEIRAIMR